MKNKTQANMKRRQKAQAKAKQRTGRTKPKYHVSDNLIAKMAEEMFPNDLWVKFCAQGCNCITSDYEAGTWTPMFESIYEGKTPDPGTIAEALVDRYGPENDKWTPEAKAALAWVAQSREVGFIYWTECLRRLRDKGVADPEVIALQPHNGTVWEVFHELKAQLLAQKSI